MSAPPSPDRYRFNPPPNWPPVPAGWNPPAGWQPPADWPAPPPSWSLWLPATEPEPEPAETTADRVGVFGARKRLRAETDRTATLTAQLAEAARHATGLTAQLAEATRRNTALDADLRHLAAQYAELRGKDGVALDRELREARARLAAFTAEEQARRAALTEEERARHRAAATAEAESAAALAEIRVQAEAAVAELARARTAIVETRETALLQEAGIYEYRHPLADAVSYQSALERIRDRIKTLAKNNGAIHAGTDWHVNNSLVEGRKMVRDFSKLMLRAYNAEADNCVRSMRPHRLASAEDRLGKVAETISRLGRTMQIAIAPAYHRLRLEELSLTADYLAKAAEEKERQRAERERLREEERAQREFEAAKAKLEKERAHWQTVLGKWAESGDLDKVAEAETKLDELDESIRGVEERAANIRTGWVYVISNVGAFGPGVVKIGLTRRQRPEDRVRELGDASVPFHFDVHGMVFDRDAVSLETELHHRLAARRVNRVNLRREFFRATPDEVLQVLRDLGKADNLIDYVVEPEAAEYRASRSPDGTE